MEYKDYNDFELLNYIYEDNEEAKDIILKKYDPLIYSKAKNFEKYIINRGYDLNDLIQEGRLGLINAIENFSGEKKATFYTYANVCIERTMLTIVKKANRTKHKVLNESISIDDENKFKDISSGYMKFIDNNPEEKLISNESIEELTNIARENLTDFEMNVLDLKISGFEYSEIADILDNDIKAVDNATQRIRKKLNTIIKEGL